MLFGHVEADYFTEERLDLLNAVGNQVMVSLQNAQLYERLNEEKLRIVGIQEQAQQQLARDLHDGPTQSVAAIAMRVNLIRRLVKDNAVAADTELQKLEELARRTTKEMRHMLFSLRPKSLESGGLVLALEDLTKQTQETFGQTVTLEATAEAVRRMDLGRQGVLFHIAAEAISNARKHANAKLIAVKLDLVEEGIALLEIRDDGTGFDLDVSPQTQSARKNLGLATLRERVELVNGIVSIESEKGRGTRIRIWVPLDEDAAERLRYGERT
jgi:signal transduction histidine kinase